MTIEQNKKCREEAEAMFALICEQEHPERFWEELAKLCMTKLPPQPENKIEIEPMSERQAIAFEAEVLQFGAYQGATIGTVPTSYCCTLAGESKLTMKFKRYVRSKRFKQRQEQED